MVTPLSIPSICQSSVHWVLENLSERGVLAESHSETNSLDVALSVHCCLL
jgi:hypothetical protein